MVKKSTTGQWAKALATLRAKQEEQFQKVFDETYRKANPDKFKNQPPAPPEPPKPPVPVENIHVEKYDPAKAADDALYRFYWRKKFKSAGLEIPPELQTQKRGRARVNEENAEKLVRFKARKKLEESGEPVPPELQRQSHANKRYMKDTA